MPRLSIRNAGWRCYEKEALLIIPVFHDVTRGKNKLKIKYCIKIVGKK